MGLIETIGNPRYKFQAGSRCIFNTYLFLGVSFTQSWGLWKIKALFVLGLTSAYCLVVTTYNIFVLSFCNLEAPFSSLSSHFQQGTMADDGVSGFLTSLGRKIERDWGPFWWFVSFFLFLVFSFIQYKNSLASIYGNSFFLKKKLII